MDPRHFSVLAVTGLLPGLKAWAGLELLAGSGLGLKARCTGSFAFLYLSRGSNVVPGHGKER